MIVDGILSWELVVMAVAFAGAGFVRGFNGGAGANFITAPVVALLIGPREGVPIITLVAILSNLQTMPGSLPHTEWRRITPICAAAAMTAPFGVWLLLAIDENLMRRVVAITSIVLALILLTGWRYRGPRGVPVRWAVGGRAGMITGSVSMGGPPVFLYLLSGSGNAVVQRANFLTFSFFVQAAAVVTFVATGLLTERTLILSAIFFMPFSLATWLGIRLFSRASETQFRNYTLWGIAVLSLLIAVF